MIETEFGIAPAVQGLPPVAPGTMPQYIQFQFNGANLGGPDATTVNFVGASIVAARANDVVTVTIG